MDKYKHVFSGIKIGNVEIKNRIEFAPAIPILASPEGYVTRELIEFEKSLARGGAGIITIGDSAIDFEYARDHDGQLNLGTDKVIPGLRMIVETIHRYGAKASIELNHGGRFVAPRFLNGKEPIGPSSIESRGGEVFAGGEEGRGKVHVREMDHNLIDQVIDNFATACYRCLLAGFDMVMLHGGHGHLLSQFTSPYANRRTDDYGGSLKNRARFVIEVLTAIREKVGNRLAIEYRISADEIIPEGMHLEETIELIKMIEDKIDLIHVSAGLITEPECNPHMQQPTYYPHAFNVHYAEKIKKAVHIPVTTVGSILDLQLADEIIRDGKADIVAMARAIIADPEIVNKTRRGELDDIRPCVRCNSCSDRSAHLFPLRCTVNPVIGREVEFGNIRPAEVKKKVVIIGGGPAGMEAAQVASSRGHQVTLYEKAEKLGGALVLAAGFPFKADMKKYLDWMVKKTLQAPVEIKLSTEATAGAIKAEKPDVLIIAGGAEPLIPDIPGVGKSNAVWVGDVLMGSAKVGERVVVAGAGMTGCETALYLAQQGKKVTLIDMLSEAEIAQDVAVISRVALIGLLHEHGVEIITGVKLEEITDKGALVINKQWDRYAIPADTVVFALGAKARSEMAEKFEGLARDTYVVGDCADPRNLMAAIGDGFDIAAEI